MLFTPFSVAVVRTPFCSLMLHACLQPCLPVTIEPPARRTASRWSSAAARPPPRGTRPTQGLLPPTHPTASPSPAVPRATRTSELLDCAPPFLPTPPSLPPSQSPRKKRKRSGFLFPLFPFLSSACLDERSPSPSPTPPSFPPVLALPPLRSLLSTRGRGRGLGVWGREGVSRGGDRGRAGGWVGLRALLSPCFSSLPHQCTYCSPSHTTHFVHLPSHPGKRERERQSKETEGQ